LNVISYCDKLIQINLNGNSIKEIHTLIFYSLNSIKNLDLSIQMINLIKPEMFELELLSFLNLRNNKIEIIEPNSFIGLVNMTILDLSNQSTIYLSNESFNGLTRLQNLTLNDNKI
jgi:Leucine-rich repeat (LRR) protein